MHCTLHWYGQIYERIQIINSMLILLSIAFIGYYGYQSINEGKDIADVYFVTPSVLIATFVSLKDDFEYKKEFLKKTLFLKKFRRYLLFWLWLKWIEEFIHPPHCSCFGLFWHFAGFSPTELAFNPPPMGYAAFLQSQSSFSIQWILRLLFQMSEEEQFPFVWSMIYFPLVFAMLFLHLFSDTPTQCEVYQYNNDLLKTDLKK